MKDKKMAIVAYTRRIFGGYDILGIDKACNYYLNSAINVIGHGYKLYTWYPVRKVIGPRVNSRFNRVQIYKFGHIDIMYVNNDNWQWIV